MIHLIVVITSKIIRSTITSASGATSHSHNDQQEAEEEKKLRNQGLLEVLRPVGSSSFINPYPNSGRLQRPLTRNPYKPISKPL